MSGTVENPIQSQPASPSRSRQGSPEPSTWLTDVPGLSEPRSHESLTIKDAQTKHPPNKLRSLLKSKSKSKSRDRAAQATTNELSRDEWKNSATRDDTKTGSTPGDSLRSTRSRRPSTDTNGPGKKRLRFLTYQPPGKKIMNRIFSNKLPNKHGSSDLSQDDFVKDVDEVTQFIQTLDSPTMSGALSQYQMTAADFTFSGPKLEDFSYSSTPRSFSLSMLAFARTSTNHSSGNANHPSGTISPLRSSTSAIYQSNYYAPSRSLSMKFRSPHVSLPDMRTPSSVDVPEVSRSHSVPNLISLANLEARIKKDAPAPALPDALFGSLLLYLDQGGIKARRPACRSWSVSMASVVGQAVNVSSFRRLPPEIVQAILRFLSPSDFNEARHICESWLKASLDLQLLSLQLRRGGWWRAAQLDLSNITSDHERYWSIEQLLSLRLVKELAMSAPHARDTSNSRLQDRNHPVQVSIMDCKALHAARKAKDQTKLRFQVSTCGNFLLMARDKGIFVYAFCGIDIRPLCNVVCPRRVMAMSMDASNKQNAVAALLDGRCGIWADLSDHESLFSSKSCLGEEILRQISSEDEEPLASTPAKSLPSQEALVLTRPRKNSWRKSNKNDRHTPRSVERSTGNAIEMPFVTRPKSVYQKIGPDFDPPRSVALCSSRRCVAFGCMTGIQLYWIDNVTQQKHDRWYPNPLPTDFLYFCHPREGESSDKKLRMCSSIANTVDQRHPLRNLARRATSGFSDIWNISPFTHPTHDAVLDPTGTPGTSTRTASQEMDHLRAVPLTDGYHALFTVAATNLLYLGGDCITGGPGKLSRTFMLVPPQGLALSPRSSTHRRRSADSVDNELPAPPRPVVYSSASDVSRGVRVVAAYGKDVVLYSVPSDVFSQSPCLKQQTRISPPPLSSQDDLPPAFPTKDLALSADWLEWVPPPSTTWSLPPTHPNSFPMQIQGLHVGNMEDEVNEVAITMGPAAHGGKEDLFADAVVWAFSAAGQKGVAWRVGADGPEAARKVKKGRVMEDGGVEMLEQ